MYGRSRPDVDGKEAIRPVRGGDRVADGETPDHRFESPLASVLVLVVEGDLVGHGGIDHSACRDDVVLMAQRVDQQHVGVALYGGIETRRLLRRDHDGQAEVSALVDVLLERSLGRNGAAGGNVVVRFVDDDPGTRKSFESALLALGGGGGLLGGLGGIGCADIELLEMARVISSVTHSQCSGLPLQADLNEKVFKLIFLDVGLMNAICGLGWDTLANQTPVQLVNAGPAAEQFIGQHLQHLLAERPNRALTYWLREGRSNNAEVDYVAEFGGRIVPIEVKAGRAGTLKSLHQFVFEKRVPFAIRFHADVPALQTVDTEIRRGNGAERVHYRLLSLPLYLVERLPRIVNGLSTVV